MPKDDDSKVSPEQAADAAAEAEAVAAELADLEAAARAEVEDPPPSTPPASETPPPPAPPETSERSKVRAARQASRERRRRKPPEVEAGADPDPTPRQRQKARRLAKAAGIDGGPLPRDWWPLLQADPAETIKSIREGAYDSFISALSLQERAHTQRAGVMAAIRDRRAELGLDDDTDDPDLAA